MHTYTYKLKTKIIEFFYIIIFILFYFKHLYNLIAISYTISKHDYID